MRTAKNRRGPVKSLSLLVGLVLIISTFLGACSSPSVALPDLSGDNIDTVSCETIVTVANTVARLDTGSSRGDKVRLENAGLNPDDPDAMKMVRDRLDKRVKQCRQEATAAATTATTTETATAVATTSLPPTDDGQSGVEDSDGELRSLPLVDQVGDQATGADTTTDPRTPATYAEALADGPVNNWAELAERMRGQRWYVDAVNDRASKTGFDWSDIERWAQDAGEYDTRVIHVFNQPELSDAQARAQASELIGQSASQLPVAQHDTCVVNTRGFSHEVVQDFTDCRQMVRVSLAPLVYDGSQIIGLRANAGNFNDCFNLWWVPRQVVKHGPVPTPSKTTSVKKKQPPVVKTKQPPVVKPKPKKPKPTKPPVRPTPTPTTTKPPVRPTPTPTKPTAKKSFPPPPGQSPAPVRPSPEPPKPSPVHTGPTLAPSPSQTAPPPPPSDGHQPSAPPVVPVPTASGTIPDG